MEIAFSDEGLRLLMLAAASGAAVAIGLRKPFSAVPVPEGEVNVLVPDVRDRTAGEPHRGRPVGRKPRRWLRRGGTAVTASVAGAIASVVAANPVLAANPIPYRPDGESQIRQYMGSPCNSAANDSRVYWPWGNNVSSGSYVSAHSYIDGVVNNVRHRVYIDGRDPSINQAVWGYDCRYISGTTKWSTHAWGAAYDTNSVRNPYGQSYWNGIGSNGVDYGTYLRDRWKDSQIGNFYWGGNFSTPDPMHFQYATGY